MIKRSIVDLASFEAASFCFETFDIGSFNYEQSIDVTCHLECQGFLTERLFCRFLQSFKYYDGRSWAEVPMIQELNTYYINTLSGRQFAARLFLIPDQPFIPRLPEHS